MFQRAPRSLRAERGKRGRLRRATPGWAYRVPSLTSSGSSAARPTESSGRAAKRRSSSPDAISGSPRVRRRRTTGTSASGCSWQPARSRSASSGRPLTKPEHRAVPNDRRCVAAAMDQAKAVVGDHFGLAIAPPLQGLGPLPGMTQLVHALTERDRVAVDDAGHDRRQLTREGDHQDLVDHSQALPDSPLLDQGAALLVAGEPDQVRVAEALADLGGDGRGGIPGLPVTARHLLQPDRNQQIAAFDAVLTRPLQ